MTEMTLLTMDDIRCTALHNRGNAAVLSELADLFIAKMNDILGGRDSMEECPRASGFVPVTEIPDDRDFESEAIGRLDGPGEDEEDPRDDGEPSDPYYDPDDDDRITVNGLNLDTYLAYVGDDGRDYGLTCDDLPLTAVEMMQEELEAETPKSYAPTSKTVRCKAERLREEAERYEERYVRRWWSFGTDYIRALRGTINSLRTEANTLHGCADIMAKGERSDARDRRLRDRAYRLDRDRRAERAFVGELRELLLTDTDPWTARADLERHGLLELDRELEAWSRSSDELLYELMLAEDGRHEELGYFCQPSDAELCWLALEETVDADDHEHDELGHAVTLCWIAGMDEDETLRMLEQLRTAIYPVSDEEADLLLKFYGLGHEDDSDWDIDPPRQSGEFGRGVALLDDDFDDVPPSIARLARKRDEEDADERARRRKYAAN